MACVPADEAKVGDAVEGGDAPTAEGSAPEDVAPGADDSAPKVDDAESPDEHANE
jgi:hypothetical protein